MSSLSILIPCLNEKRTIEKVIEQASREAKKHLDDYEIIVADNGSTDGTLEKLRKIHRRNFKLVNVPIRGYGAALHYGILSAKYNSVLFADADMSYNFNNLKKFLPYISSEFGLILGSRLKGKISKGSMPFLNRYFGTPMLTFLIRIIYGIMTTDCNSGMRMVRKDFYKKLDMRNRGMEWASELIIKTAAYKGLYSEVPIVFTKDKRGDTPHLNRWADGWRHLKAIVLLKPSLLLIIGLSSLMYGVVFIPYSVFNFISFSLIAELFFLSYLATKKIEAAIEKVPNPISKKINQVPLVPVGIFISALGILQLFLINDTYFFIKYFFLSQVILFDVWLFFIETIDTHITNRLP
jgi:glycosyltransferase involved in cell wall biosynthesis